jgi:hypothetical protein
MVEDTSVRDAASGVQSPDADIISAWKADFDAAAKHGSFALQVLLDLPSGKQIKAVRMPLLLMLQQGSIPDRLTTTVAKFIESIEGGSPDEMETKLLDTFVDDPVKAAQSWIELLDYVLCTIAVTPEFTNDRDKEDTEKGIFWSGRVNLYDKLWVFQWSQGVDSSIEEFFQQQIDAMGVASDGEGVRLTPEQLLATGEFGYVMDSVPDGSGNVDVGDVYPSADRRSDRSSGEQSAESSDRTETEVQPQADHVVPDRPADIVPEESVV